MDSFSCNKRLPAWWVSGLIALAFVSGCSSSDPFGGDVQWYNISTTVTFSGPMPVYNNYDGESPLSPIINAGLFRPGSNSLSSPLYLYQETFDAAPLNMSGKYSLANEVSSYFLDAGMYNLVIYSAANPYDYNDLTGYKNPIILNSGPPVTVDYSQAGVTLEPLNLNFTGPGPYGSVSGRFLTSGNPGNTTYPQLVFMPAEPQPGVSTETGLVWTLAAGYLDGQYWFSVPDIAYGDYELSYAGYSLRDRDNPLKASSIPITISAEHPDIDGIVFNTTNAVPQEQTWELGRISGTLTLPATPDSGEVYCLTAQLSSGVEGSTMYGSAYETARWLMEAEDFDSANTAEFDLGWLVAGVYNFIAIQLGDSSDSTDLELGMIGSATLEAGAHELTGVELEVAQ